MKREQWGSRVGFILAAVGSAIGLGNIWRFPYIAYENGGGAFLIPYLFAMLTAGIPFMILEFGVGHKFKGSAPRIFASMSANWEWLGWWQIVVNFTIAVYYIAVVGWSIVYCWLAFTQGWGEDTSGFFFKSFLHLTGSPTDMGDLQWPIFGAIAFSWFVCWVFLFRGVKTGIETAGKIFMPLLFVMVLLFTGRAIFLPGASEGLNWFLKPDFSRILDYKVWAAAYGQIFYSLSIGFGIMLTYSSYLPKKSDINNNAFITVFVNCGFSLVAGLMIFSVLGNMAVQQGVPVSEVVSSGVGLAFITIPKAINLLPAPVFFGSLFFMALVFAGLSSEISICETVTAALIDKFGWNRKAASSIFCVVGFAVSIVFAMGSGLLILDIVDHFVNNYGILLGGLAEIIFLTWLLDVEDVRKHVNAVSDFSVGIWWDISLKYITTFALGYMVVANLISDFSKPYGGYPTSSLFYFGWHVLELTLLIALIMHFKPSAVSVTSNGGNN
ncbi:MAG: sodium-dependent transporter [Desulfoplanes sp.]